MQLSDKTKSMLDSVRELLSLKSDLKCTESFVNLMDELMLREQQKAAVAKAEASMFTPVMREAQPLMQDEQEGTHPGAAGMEAIVEVSRPHEASTESEELMDVDRTNLPAPAEESVAEAQVKSQGAEASVADAEAAPNIEIGVGDEPPAAPPLPSEARGKSHGAEEGGRKKGQQNKPPRPPTPEPPRTPSVGGLARSSGGGLYLASDWETRLDPPPGAQRRDPQARLDELYEQAKR